MRRTVGWVVAGLGIVIAAVGALGDTLGLGGEGEDELGPKQIIAIVVGLVLLGVGVALALLSKEPAAE